MPTSEKFCLKWNDFQKNIGSVFGSLRKDNEFTDVTLACEDGYQVEAHKAILASSSPFFQNLLSRNKHAHPLIYMRSVKSEDLVALIDFLYFGEANIYQENLDTFLNIAEELKLKGINGGGNGGGERKGPEVGEDYPKYDDVSTVLKSAHQKNYVEIETKMSTQNYPVALETSSEEQHGPENAVALTKQEFVGEIGELDRLIHTMMSRGEHFVKKGNLMTKA